MGQGKGYGKTILFGEHFVVYGLPAIASAISAATIANVERLEGQTGWQLDDQRPEVPGYKAKKASQQQKSIENVLSYCGIDTTEIGIKISYSGDLTCASGFGASAASCSSLARALNNEFNLGFDDEKINEAAYEGEKAYHGSPSGIDNTCSTYGGLVWYKRNLEGGKNLVETMHLAKPVELVLASSGISANTTEVVADVRAKKDADPDWFDEIINQYSEIIQKARHALTNLNFEEVGQLMNANHRLLQEITVSCTELDDLVETARANGAIGAKLTGTGRGGIQISLTPGKELQDKVTVALEAKGVRAWKARIGI
ncbi:MAG: mevalonate kinase [Candidatus Heimdallarchaeota archaeon]